MLDIGLGEVIIIAILALLVFGPDRLPKVASDAAKTLRQVRQMAAAARKDLTDAAGLEEDDEIVRAVRDIQELDPRRALRGLGDDPAPKGSGGGAAGRSSTGRAARGSATGAGAGPTGAGVAGAGAAGAAAAAGGPAGAGPAPGTDAPTGTGLGPDQVDPGQSAAGPVLEAYPVDPDWT